MMSVAAIKAAPHAHRASPSSLTHPASPSSLTIQPHASSLTIQPHHPASRIQPRAPMDKDLSVDVGKASNSCPGTRRPGEWTPEEAVQERRGAPRRLNDHRKTGVKWLKGKGLQILFIVMFLFIAIEVGWIPLPSWLWTTRMDRLEQAMTGKMDNLKTAEITNNRTIQDLTGKVDYLKAKNKNTIQDLKARMKTLKDDKWDLKARVGKLDGMSDKRKVWFAATGGDKKTNDSKVIFQNVDTNVGSHYDATTGIFTAPYKGAYFFTVTYRSDGGMINVDMFREKMYKKTEYLMSLYDNIQKRSRASNSKMVDLEDGDKVYVYAYSSHVLTCCANVFSGFLVYPM
ncbi:uncharacterized protein LOC129173602 [Dunckerocampus dactyliophorus]|uniref:uncharacterized protein LOC129173602 n=1 Tax=Dunckerocampus dactyliophorus TaxID=161453 RepID=UPI002406C580|nr:uncharacterized protein LOC129173602 [Dunckerocampus dactyliophorus]